jgi:hypothetical protein
MQLMQRASLVAAALFLATAAQAQDAEAGKKIFAASKASVVQIFTDTGTGAGFLLKKADHIATAYHVIEGAKEIKVVVGDDGETTLKVKAVMVDKDSDTAILVLEKPMTSKPLPVGDPDAMSVGDKVYVIGHPRGLTHTLSEGIISSKRKVDDTHWLQMTAAISPGNSGGPVFDSKGQVIGCVSFYVQDGQQLNLASSITHMSRLFSATPTPIDAFTGASKKSKGATGKTAKELITKDYAKMYTSLATTLLKWDLRSFKLVQMADWETPLEECYAFAKKMTVAKEWEAFLETVGESDLAKTEDLEKMLACLKSISELALERAEADSDFYFEVVDGNSKTKREAAMNASSEAYRRLHRGLVALDDVADKQKWYDWDTFVTAVPPPIVYQFFGRRITGAYADPLFPTECYVAYAKSTSKLKTGDRVVAMKGPAQLDFKPVKNWLELSDLFDELKDADKTVMLKVRRGGEEIEVEVEVQ